MAAYNCCPRRSWTLKLVYFSKIRWTHPSQDGPCSNICGNVGSNFQHQSNVLRPSLKNYKWKVEMLNQDVREKPADLVAAGHASDPTDLVIPCSELIQLYWATTSRNLPASENTSGMQNGSKTWASSWTELTTSIPNWKNMVPGESDQVKMNKLLRSMPKSRSW